MTNPVVFADTSYWIGLFSKKDQNHQIATEIVGQLKLAKIVTTELVLSEFLNAMSNKGSNIRSAAVTAVKVLQNKIEIVCYNCTPFDLAFSEYEKYADKEWGLVDCASFNLMHEKGIDTAVSFDGDFEQAGFRIIPQRD